VKNVRNKSRSPLRIPLSLGKFLHLGPMKTGQIADGDAERPAVRKLIEDGQIEIVGEGTHPASAADAPGAVHESTQGHVPEKNVRPKGNRGG
jgi:hypothetical protein